MTKFDCGFRIMTDVITLNDRNQPNWNYLLKTFVNVCGKCYKKQMKFQYMENKLLVMEKQRMEMFLENEDEDTYFDLTELKEHLKTLPPNERHKVKDFERLRNLANGQDPNEGMSEIDMVIKELEEEERENKNQPEPENWTSPQKLLLKKKLYIVRGCYLHIKTVGGVKKKWLTKRFYWTRFSLLEFVMRYVVIIFTVQNVKTWEKRSIDI